MNDLEFLQSYLAEPEERAEEVKSTFLGKPLQAPQLPAVSSPVKIDVPEQTGELIEKGKKKGGKGFMQSVSGAKKSTEKALGAAVPSLDDFPTPPSKGVGLLLFISLLMVFAITSVGAGGETRLSLLWGSILGNYTIKKGGSTTSKGTARNPSGQPAPNPLPPDPLDPWGIQGGLT